MVAVHREYLSYISITCWDSGIHSNASLVLTRWNETITGACVRTFGAVLLVKKPYNSRPCTIIWGCYKRLRYRFLSTRTSCCSSLNGYNVEWGGGRSHLGASNHREDLPQILCGCVICLNPTWCRLLQAKESQEQILTLMHLRNILSWLVTITTEVAPAKPCFWSAPSRRRCHLFSIFLRRDANRQHG